MEFGMILQWICSSEDFNNSKGIRYATHTRAAYSYDDFFFKFSTFNDNTGTDITISVYISVSSKISLFHEGISTLETKISFIVFGALFIDSLQHLNKIR